MPRDPEKTTALLLSIPADNQLDLSFAIQAVTIPTGNPSRCNLTALYRATNRR